MATYPTSLGICVGTRVKIESGIETDRATNGTPRGRSFFTSDKYTFRLEHKALDATARAELMAFYSANRLANDISLTLDGATYTCMFADAPQPDYIGGWRAGMTVELMQV